MSGRNVRSAFVFYVLFLLFDFLTASSFPITGATGGLGPNGERPLRYEINDFEKSGPAFDLFILALRDFQSLDQSDPLSYFQIAGLSDTSLRPMSSSPLLGIHGYPHIPWDGVGGTGPYGFCVHAATPFPTWHRPYLALYEVCLSSNSFEFSSFTFSLAHFSCPIEFPPGDVG